MDELCEHGSALANPHEAVGFDQHPGTHVDIPLQEFPGVVGATAGLARAKRIAGWVTDGHVKVCFRDCDTDTQGVRV